MNRSFTVVVLAIASSTGSLGQNGITNQYPSPPAGSGVETTILAMERQAAEAVRTGDVATLEKQMADDYIGIGPNGKVRTKAEVLDRFRSGRVKYESITTSDLRVRVYGKTVVVIGMGKIKAHVGHNAQSRFHTGTRGFGL